MSGQVNEQLYFRLLIDYCFNTLDPITPVHPEWNQQQLGCLSTMFCLVFLQTPPRPSIKALRTFLQIIALIFHPLVVLLFFSSPHLRLHFFTASFTLPQTLYLYIFPSSSLLLNHFLPQSFSPFFLAHVLSVRAASGCFYISWAVQY